MRVLARCLALASFAAAMPAWAEAPVTFRQFAVDVDVNTDGSAVENVHIALQANNDALAQRIAQQPVTYSVSREKLTILEAYTEKPDGTRLAVDATAIHTQLVPGAANFPLFDDQERKVVVFPSVAAHDTLVYSLRREIQKPLIPGQFAWSSFLNRSVSWQDYRLTITAPTTLPLKTEQHGIDMERAQDGGRVIYRFHAAYPDAIAMDRAAVGPFQRMPRVFVSSLPDYAALARAYAELALPKEAVTPDIQRLADRLTEGIADRKAQAHALYDWVSTHIRYVGVWLNRGLVEPHAASAVLEAGYGDCKDHSVLFGALLKARGIQSEPVLINFGNEYRLPGPPTFGVLNHVITWLPEFAMYADTTAEVAPFGVLPFQEYGKPVVHAGATLPVERQTPVLAPAAQAVESLVTKAQLGEDGTIEGESSTIASGPFSIALRLAAKAIDREGQENAAQARLKSSGEDGSGSFGFPPLTAIDGDYSVVGHFHLDARPELLDGDTFALPVGLRLLPRPGDLLLGPLGLRNLKDNEPTPCYAGRQSETLSLALPMGWQVARLPRDVAIDNALLHYETHWTAAQHLVSVQRSVTSTIGSPLCEGETRREIAEALSAIRRDLNVEIGLRRSEAISEGQDPP